MRVLVFGSGGVGGYFGARLAEAGMDVVFLARGAHFEALQKNGLILKSIDGDLHLDPINIVKNLHDVSKQFDLIILGIKSHQIGDSVELLKTVISDNTIVLPLQNGVNVVERLLTKINRKNLVAGFCKIYTKIDSYGIIDHFAHSPEILLGELDNSKSQRILNLKEELDKAKFQTIIPEDIHSEIWKKFMFICSVSGMGALTRISIGEMYKSDGIRGMMRKTVEEIYAVAVAKGIDLPANIVDLIMRFIEKQPFESTASLQRDLIAGRPSELDNYNGYIVDEAIKFGINTPINCFIYNCLLPLELKARSRS